ncbi:ATP-binding protein [Gordonia humi]|uniref:Histidine kinase/HSP90-like ATPase domain-containing protein n=1 Tax=Gordonia humi TaxID=686429 RepID=A0A840ER31_9ACTN|nr:ATP-binding protein [Gordonia humi]MBB4135295.1 hypothetical protein [Gordonia humi]
MNEYRLRRAAALTVAVCTVVVACISVLALVRGAQITRFWWTPVSLTMIVGSALVLFVVARPVAGRGLDALVYAILTIGAANLLALALWFVAWTGRTSAVVGSPPVWVANTVALPAVALATVARLRWAMTYAVVALGTLALVQQQAGFGGVGADAFANQVMTLALLGVFLTMLAGALRIARDVDARRAAVLVEAVESATAAARTAEDRRLDVVVRDRIIAVLRDIGVGRPDERHRADAAVALADLDGSLAGTHRPTETAAASVAIRFRETVTAFGDDDVLVSMEAAVDAADLPDDVVDVLGDALSEAVGNALTHAGPDASTVVVGRIADAGVRIRVFDDGLGFDLDRVAADRSGIALGIVGRLASLPGGSADIRTSPDEGTMVSLEWSRA